MGDLDIGSYGIADGDVRFGRYGTVAATDPDLRDEVMSANPEIASLMSRAAMPVIRESRGAVVAKRSARGLARWSGSMAVAPSPIGVSPRKE